MVIKKYEKLRVRVNQLKKLKNDLRFCFEAKGWFFLILCYHARHLQQIHWSKLLCGMFGLTVKSSIAGLNICQILMRFVCMLCNMYVSNTTYICPIALQQYISSFRPWKSRIYFWRKISANPIVWYVQYRNGSKTFNENAFWLRITGRWLMFG